MPRILSRSDSLLHRGKTPWSYPRNSSGATFSARSSNGTSNGSLENTAQHSKKPPKVPTKPIPIPLRTRPSLSNLANLMEDCELQQQHGAPCCLFSSKAPTKPIPIPLRTRPSLSNLANLMEGCELQHGASFCLLPTLPNSSRSSISIMDDDDDGEDSWGHFVDFD